ncbi:MAG: Stp1/IreP family PP2C-type Ser/Thr phosphatase [Proteobacteria bacterium]|nr:Stp1/IreP family PP2C-type Ser/Thr phosphatase [Pseudomonadota bacterium]
MRSAFKVTVAGKTDIGQKRSGNQDSFLVNEELQLFAVADGMGGHSGGEVASELAIKTLEKFYEKNPEKHKTIPELLSSCVSLCNKAIFEHARTHSELMGMGTTITVCALDKEWVHIAQVGDSRCYLFRDGDLFQLTEDHSQVYEMLKAGLINEASLHSFHKNVITRSVGYEEDVQVDVFSRKVISGDRYIICSDGLSGMVSNIQIAQILYNFSIEKSAENLIELANLQGGEDNVTVIAFELK